MLVAFAFLGAIVGRDLRALASYPWSIRPGVLALSLLVHVAGLAWGVWIWQRMLRHMGIDLPFLPLARIRALASLGRYIPGKIWEFVGAAHLGTATGIPVAVTLTSLAVFTGFVVTGALLLSAWLLPLEAMAAGVRLDWLRWAAPLLLVFLHPAVVRFSLRLLGRLTRREPVRWTGSWLDGVGFVALTLVSWALGGLALYLFILSFTTLPPSTIPAVIGINAAAFAAGVAVFVAPAGLGAKEGALAALLTLFIPAPVAALLAVASRLWTVAGEVLPVLLLARLRGGAGGPPGEAAAAGRASGGPPG